MTFSSIGSARYFSGPFFQRFRFGGYVKDVRLRVVRSVVVYVASKNPFYRLLFQVGCLVNAVTWGGFFLGVAFDSKCRRFYARFFRGKYYFGEVLGTVSGNRGAGIMISGSGKLWGFDVNTIAGLDVHRG